MILLLVLLLFATPSHAELLNLIAEVPEETSLDETWCAANPGPCYETFRLDMERTTPMAPDTHATAGKKLSLVTLDVDGTAPLALIEGLFLIYQLPWQVVCLQSFGATEPILDAQGVEIGRQAKVYKACDQAKLFSYQNDRTDKDGNQLSHELNWAATWEGAAPWR